MPVAALACCKDFTTCPKGQGSRSCTTAEAPVPGGILQGARPAQHNSSATRPSLCQPGCFPFHQQFSSDPWQNPAPQVTAWLEGTKPAQAEMPQQRWRGGVCVYRGRSNPVPKSGTLWPQRGYFAPLARLPLGLESRAPHLILITMTKPQSSSSRAEMTFPITGELEACWAVTASQETLSGPGAQPATSLLPVLHPWLRGATHARRSDEHVGLEPKAQGGQIQASRQLLAIQTWI